MGNIFCFSQQVNSVYARLVHNDEVLYITDNVCKYHSRPNTNWVQNCSMRNF